MRLTLFLDHACNLRCTYCYNGEHFARAMSFETAKAAVDLVLDGGLPLKQVGFFGGEPFLRFDLIREVTRYVRERTAHYERPVTMVITTNGALITDAHIPWLSEKKFHMGISIDGCPPAHDACRVKAGGKGSYDEVAAGIRRVLEAGLPLKCITVIDPANVDYLGESLRHLLDLGLRQMSFNLNYEGNWDEANRARFEAAAEDLADAYVAAYRQGLQFKVNVLDAKIITHVKGGFACSDRCDFGCEELAVSPSGKLYPCDRLIGEDTRDDVVIGDVWKGIDLAARARLIEEKNKVMDDCRDCDVEHRCMHWCGCVNYAMTGSVGGVSGLLCWFEQTLIDVADRAAETLYAEKNPRFIERFYGRVLKD
jgi:uncharacterized protein